MNNFKSIIILNNGTELHVDQTMMQLEESLCYSGYMYINVTTTNADCVYEYIIPFDSIVMIKNIT